MIPLEDNFSDIFGKAQRGLGVSLWGMDSLLAGKWDAILHKDPKGCCTANGNGEHMRRTRFVIAVCILCIQSILVNQAKLLADTPDIREIAKEMRGNFANIHSIAYATESSGEMTDEVMKMMKIPEDYKKGNTISKVRMTQKYWNLEYTSFTQSGKVSSDWIHSFDGIHYARLEKTSRYLTISKKPPDNWQFISNYTAVFSPFAFLCRKDAKFHAGRAELLLADLQDDEIWERFIKNAKVVSEDEKEYTLDIQMPDIPDYRTKEPFRWTLKVSKNHACFPVYLERRGMTGQIWDIVEVKEIGLLPIDNKASFVYPKIAEGKGFQLLCGTKPDGVGTTHITNIQANKSNEDAGDDYAVDPSLAHGIMDEDTNKYIEVPH